MKDTIFAPSFGNKPQTLVGRQEIIRAFSEGLQSMPGSRERAMHTAIDSAIEDYKNDICATTLVPLSDADVAFLESMSEDEGISRTGELAERMGVSGAYIQQYKRRLIEAGVIEQIRRGEVQFALPYVKEYLRAHGGLQ